MISISYLLEQDYDLKKYLKKEAKNNYLKGMGQAALGGGVLSSAFGAISGGDPVLSGVAGAVGSGLLTGLWNANDLRKTYNAINAIKLKKVKAK